VTDIVLPDTVYETYKAQEDQTAFVESLAQAKIREEGSNLLNLCEVVERGLYTPQDPNTLMVVQIIQ
jgi:hypothetical protein